MLANILVYTAVLASLSYTSLSIRVLPNLSRSKISNLGNLKHLAQQAPLDIMNLGPVQPPQLDPSNDGTTGDDGDGTLTISDILPKTRSINIFASLTRDISSLSQRLESHAAESNTTLLAPLNSVMQSLPRKPWEDRPRDQSGVSATRNEDKAADNLRRFVESHVVPMSPWAEGADGKIKTLGGGEVWWEKDGKGRRVIMPGRVEVDGVVGRVGNGQIWALKGVVSYA